MNDMYLCIALLIQITGCRPSDVVPGNGSFLVSGIFQLTNPDTSLINYQSGIMMEEAMRYAINEINKNTSYMYGYKLKMVEEDKPNFKSEDDVRSKVLSTFLKGIPFLIGPYSSELSYITSILTDTFQLVSVSYAATYSEFSSTQNFMFRTVPSDTYRIEAALALLKELEWNYVAVVSSYGYDGERDGKHFVSKLQEINVCLSLEIDLSKSTTRDDFIDALAKLKKDHRLKAIVMFTTIEDSRKLISTFGKDDVVKNFLFLCMYGCGNYKEVVEGIEKRAAGVISINVASPAINGFKDYFLKLKPNRHSTEYFKTFWEKTFKCSFKIGNCTGKEQLAVGRGYYPLTPVHTVINAVSVIAEALKTLIQLICFPTQPWMKNHKQCVVNPKSPKMYTNHVSRILKNFAQSDGTLKQSKIILKDTDNAVRYDIHHFLPINGTYKNLHMGTWYLNETIKKKIFGTFVLNPAHAWHLRNGSVGKPAAICSKECPPGHIRSYDSNPRKEKCCWDCVLCPPNNIVGNDTCVPCLETEMAVMELDKCIRLPLRFIELKDNPAPTFFTMASIVGLCLITVVIAFFIKYNHYRMVRASGRDLCYMILFGMSLMFLCPFFFLGAPSVGTCLLRSGLPGVAFLSVYAPLFLKTNRIYRIFCHAKRSVSRPSLVSSRSLLLLSFGIVVVQILLVGVWFVSQVPVPEIAVSKDKKYITSHCRGDSSPILLLLNVALSVLFMISCTVLAFKTRHFPKNYNEAKFIGITLYVTCVAWSIFLPAYFLLPETDFVREYFMCGICIAIGYITLFGLFGHKIRLLMCQKNLDNANGNLPTWYLSYSDCKENGDAMMSKPDQNGNSDETIA